MSDLGASSPQVRELSGGTVATDSSSDMLPTPPLVLASVLDTRNNDKFSANVEPVVFSLARFVDSLRVFLSYLTWNYDSESACNASFVGCFHDLFRSLEVHAWRRQVRLMTDYDLGRFQAGTSPAGSTYAICELQRRIREIRLAAGDISQSSARSAPAAGEAAQPSLSVLSDRLRDLSLGDTDEEAQFLSSTTAGTHFQDGIRRPDLTIIGMGEMGNTAAVGLVAEHKVSSGAPPRPIVRVGLAQALVQLVSAGQTFGTYLGYAMVNASFGRMVRLDVDTVALESSATLADSNETDRIFSAGALLHTDLLTTCLPLTLRKATADEVAVDAKGAARFYRLVRLAATVVLDHDAVTCPPLSIPATLQERVARLLWVHADPETLTAALKDKARAWLRRLAQSGQGPPSADDASGDGPGDGGGAGAGADTPSRTGAAGSRGRSSARGRGGRSGSRRGKCGQEPGGERDHAGVHGDSPSEDSRHELERSASGSTDAGVAQQIPLPDPYVPPPPCDTPVSWDGVPRGSRQGLADIWPYDEALKDIAIILVTPDEMDGLIDPVLALEMEKQAQWESRETQATSRREEESATPKSGPAALGEESSSLTF